MLIRGLTRILIGFFLMPIFPMYVVDVLFLSRGIDAINRFETVPARVISITEEKVDVRRTRHGNQGAIYEHRVRPLVTYEYAFNGRVLRSNRFFLFEGTALSDRLEDSDKDGSVSNRMRQALGTNKSIEIKVASTDQGLTFIDYGWDVLRAETLFWLKTYLTFAVLIIFGWLIVSVGRTAQKNRSSKE